MQAVRVKGVANPMQFPDDMGVEDIKSFLKRKFANLATTGSQPADLAPLQGQAQATQQSLAQRAGQGVSDALFDSGIISDRYGAQRIGQNVTSLGEFLPVVGDAAAGDEFGRALKQGDNVGMALGALGAIPLVGDAAKKVFKGKVFHQTDADFKDFDFDKTADGTVWFTGDKANFSDPSSSAGAAAGKGRIIEREVELNKVAGYDELDKYSIDELMQQGYDGAVLDGDIQVFDPKAIKPLNQSSVLGGGGVKKVNEYKGDYPIDDFDNWWGDRTYKEQGASMFEMSPDDYLSQVKPLKMDDETLENVDDLVSHMESGRKLDPLVIYADGKEDGRHRALAAKKLGFDTVPVIDYRASSQ
tara:strand:- start:653 stop:1726 length:1074 start_codon:yes stop_codon:yes gene_type:complete